MVTQKDVDEVLDKAQVEGGFGGSMIGPMRLQTQLMLEMRDLLHRQLYQQNAIRILLEKQALMEKGS